MKTSEQIRKPVTHIGGALRSKPIKWFIEMADKVVLLENVAEKAKHLVHSISSPAEPTNLAKSSIAIKLFAEDLQRSLVHLESKTG